ncbi:hypothetical protein HanRHA438_Chr06g0255471 [Helianthus annuus]|nr:hypothetical protein HanRHA438_Chr06g0255471 [Helianthus annuus]
MRWQPQDPCCPLPIGSLSIKLVRFSVSFSGQTGVPSHLLSLSSVFPTHCGTSA